MRFLTTAVLALSLSLCACSKETRLNGAEPNTGTFTGGEEVVLKGANLPTGGVTVRFGTKDAQPAVVESDSAIRVTTPAGDKNTNTDITVVFDNGQAFVLKNGFRYIDTTQQRQTMDKFFNKASGEKK
jgi:hypothetical protein